MSRQDPQDANILILLATFNAERFVLDQLRSLGEQTFTAFEIIVSDDSSNDSTRNIVERFCSENFFGSSKTILNQSGWSGAVGNFSNLCIEASRSDGDIFLFCDHDDEWFPDKVEKSLHQLDLAYCQHNFTVPMLVFSDLEVVDANGSTIATSFVEYQGLPDPAKQPLELLLHQNVVTGCTTCFNRALLDIASPIPYSAVMHDHWLALCARVFGHWFYIDEPLIRYRQHSSNVVGAKSAKLLSKWYRLEIYLSLLRFPQHFSQAVEQAKALHERMLLHSNLVSANDILVVQRFSNLRNMGVFNRVKVGLLFFPGSRRFGERLFLAFTLIVLPWIRVKGGSSE